MRPSTSPTSCAGRRAPSADRIILVITFLLTVFADLVVAVNVGVILATLHFLRRMSETVETQQLDARSLRVELAEHGVAAPPPGVLVYEIAGPMFFGAVENFERALLQTRTDPKALVIRLRRVPFMDITGIQTLDEVAQKLRRRGVQVTLCEANARVLGKLRRAGVLGADGSAAYAEQFVEALHAAAALAPAEEAATGMQEIARRLIETSKAYLHRAQDPPP